MARRHARWLVVWGFTLLAWVGAVAAQVPNGAVPSGAVPGGSKPVDPTPSPRTATEPNSPRPEAVVPTGGPFPAIDPEAPPPYHVSALQLDGVVTGDLVQFTVDVDVEINRADNAYYDVPLRLSQGHLFEKKYDGPGKDGPAPAVDGDDGLHWRFSGAGTHHLQLKMWVPIKRTGGTNGLTVSLPQLPPFFDARFKLRIPGKRITVRVPKEVLLGETKTTADATEISGSVRGTRLEINWNESAVDVPAIGRVTTLMTLKHDADRLTLLGEQTIQRERTSTSEIFVRMPTAGQLVELVSPHVRMHEPATNRPGWRRVVLQETAPDRIDLRWSFDMPFPTAGGRITIDGLEVAEARVQEGGVHLSDFGTHLAVARMNESPLVRRVDVSTARSAVPIVNAFEFVKQPFALVLDIQKVQPRYSVRPAHWLLIREDELLLESAFQIEVENGALSDLTVAWTTARNEGWRIDTASPGLFDLTPVEAESALGAGAIPIRLRAPTTGKLEVRLRFRRPNPAMGKEIAWTLPKIPGGRALPSLMTVAGDDNVLPKVTPDPQATEEQGPVASPAAPVEFADLPRTTWRVASRAEGGFKAHVSLKEREIDVATTVSVSRQPGRGLLVRQTMKYHVRFGRLLKVRFRLPAALAEKIPEGAEQAAISARLGGSSLAPLRQADELQFALPTPRIGEFEVALEYAYPVDTEASQTIDLSVPILQLAEGAFSSVRCILPDGEGLSIADMDAAWEPIPTAPESTVWFSSRAPQAIPLRVTGSLRQESQRYSIESAFHHVQFDGAGASVTYSEYALRSPPARIAFTIPSGAEQPIFDWSGRTLSETNGGLRTDPSLPGRYLIELRSEDLVGEGRLRMVYRQAPPANRGWGMLGRRSIELPQFPPNVWIARSVCEIALTRDDHLLQSPPALLPEFAWRRQGVLWTRNPVPRYAESRSQAVTVPAFHGIDLTSYGYAFSGTGPVERFAFTAMNRTLIVLIGAGLSLVLGFLFWQFPWTRNAQTFLIVAFSVSLLSLWLLEPIQVLLQPALLGAVLAVAASFIDTRSRTPEWPDLSHPSILVPPSPPPTPPRDSRSHPAGNVAATAIYQPAASHHELGP